MADTLQNPLWFWFYLVGIVMVCFHFANGLWSFLVTWGVTVGPRSQRATSAATMFLFVVLALWGVAILLRFT